MQYENLKHISIKDFLSEQGIYPMKEYAGYGMYKSPFRNERNASFKVDYKENIWRDFGSKEGGSIIDLVMKMQQCSLIAATQILQNKSHSFFLQREKSFDNKTTITMAVTTIQPLENSKLLAFLKSRKINFEIAKAFCREVHYQIGERNYFALGFPNDSGGYELRNPQFKGCLPPKEITTFDHNTNTVHLFEGFMDYLSLLTMQSKQADVSAVVLNSVTNLGKAVPFLSKHEKINAFLDNDEAGKLTLEKLQKHKLPVVDYSIKYTEFKDLNDFLCGKKTVRQIKTEIQPQSKQPVPKPKRIKF